MSLNYNMEQRKKFSLRAEEKDVLDNSSNSKTMTRPIHEFIVSFIDPITGKSEDIARSQDISELTFLIGQKDIDLKIDDDLMQYLILHDQTSDEIDHQI